ncbi:chorismate-binding protein [Bradyrhizobium sp. TZ2]
MPATPRKTSAALKSFPGGSITGAPKVRSMEIIAEIERVARELYCGRSASSASTDTWTRTLRSALYDRRRPGYVSCRWRDKAMSEPKAEYEETLVKAQPILDAFRADTSGAF